MSDPALVHANLPAGQLTALADLAVLLEGYERLDQQAGLGAQLRQTRERATTSASSSACSAARSSSSGPTAVVAGDRRPGHPMGRHRERPMRAADLPPHVRVEVQRILDGAARRLLADQLDRDPVRAPARRHHDPSDDGANDSAPLVERQRVPVRRPVDGERGGQAA